MYTGKVSIIIVNYNGIKFNVPCIHSILEQEYTDFEIVFVDNASTDNSLSIVKETFSQEIAQKKIIIVEHPINTGFAEGNNIGVSNADPLSTYICLINNDTILPKDWLYELIKGINHDKTIGGVGSMILDKGYEKYFTDMVYVSKKTCLNNYIMEPVFRPITPHELESGVIYTTGLSGCSYLYKKALIEKPFIGTFFGYGEDTYLSFCILLEGYKLALCSKSIVYHHGSGSFGKEINVFKAFHGVKNQLTNIIIFHSLWNIIVLIPVFLLFQLVKICSGNFIIRLKGFIMGIRWCLTHLKTISKERRKVHKKAKISYKMFMNMLSNQVFENTYYFIVLPKYKVYIMNILNRICKIYLYLIYTK